MDFQFRDKHLPGLFQASDKASLNAQSNYLIFTKLELGLLVCAAIASLIPSYTVFGSYLFNMASALSLLTSIILVIIKKNNRYDKFWYEGRALAESVKTLSWRFVTQSKSFEGDLDQSIATFREKMSSLQSEFIDLVPELDTTLLSLPSISDEMIEIRKLSFEERKAFYLEHRISNQYQWYADRAKFNRTRAKRFFLFTCYF